MPRRDQESLEIRSAALDDPAARSMIKALNAELDARYPEEGANHFRLDSGEVASGRGVFLLGYLEGRPVASGALRKLDERDVEIKRMYVAPGARGLGFGRQMLARLEVEARGLGAQRLVLETGERQVEAVALYESEGFTRIPRFGEYIDSPLSLCLARELTEE